MLYSMNIAIFNSKQIIRNERFYRTYELNCQLLIQVFLGKRTHRHVKNRKAAAQMI